MVKMLMLLCSVLVMTAPVTWAESTDAKPKFDVDPALAGTWSNNTQGNIVGIQLKEDGECEVFVERALKPRSNKACRFEPFQDTYNVFLYNEHGVCGFTPDFEFSFDADAPLVYFTIGNNPIPLSKQPKE